MSPPTRLGQVRLIIEPAAAALAAARATARGRQPIHASLAAMEASREQATQTAAHKAFGLAILDVAHNPAAAGYLRRDRHDPERGIRVAGNSVDSRFEDNLANHAPSACAIEEGDVEYPAMP